MVCISGAADIKSLLAAGRELQVTVILTSIFLPRRNEEILVNEAEAAKEGDENASFMNRRDRSRRACARPRGMVSSIPDSKRNLGYS